MSDSLPTYSVVIPFYNEAENVGSLLAEVQSAMQALAQPYEMILVNDGSRDHTLAVLEAKAKKHPGIRIFSFEQNRGQAAALFAGLKAARGSLLITLDGDGQNDPSDIPILLGRLGGADMVVGVRAERQDSLLRRLMSRLGNGVRSFILGDGIHDSGCALKVFRREVVAAFIPIKTLYSFMPALAMAAGFSVVECPVHHRHRLAGLSNYNLGVFFWRPLLDLMGFHWYCRRRFNLVDVIEMQRTTRGLDIPEDDSSNK